MKNEDSHKKHKKRRSDEHQHHHEKKYKRFRQNSNEEDNTEVKDPDNIEATYINIEYLTQNSLFSFRSNVDDVMDDIFGKDDNEVR